MSYLHSLKESLDERLLKFSDMAVSGVKNWIKSPKEQFQYIARDVEENTEKLGDLIKKKGDLSLSILSGYFGGAYGNPKDLINPAEATSIFFAGASVVLPIFYHYTLSSPGIDMLFDETTIKSVHKRESVQRGVRNFYMIGASFFATKILSGNGDIIDYVLAPLMLVPYRMVSKRLNETFRRNDEILHPTRQDIWEQDGIMLSKGNFIFKQPGQDN